MADRPGTIDLGLVPREPPEADTPPPAVVRLRHWAAGRAWHWWPAAAVAVLVTLATGGATVAAEPTLTPIFAVPGGDRPTLDGKTLYLIDITDALRPGLTAYRLDDGQVRWTVPVPGNPSMLGRPSLSVAHGVPLTTTEEIGLETTAHDPATGQPRWRHPGRPLGPGPHGLVLLHDARQPGGVSAVDVATGDTAWTVPDGQGFPGPVLDGGRLITQDGGRVVTTYDAATGARLASLRMPDDTITRVAAGPVVVLQSFVGRAGMSVTAYDPDTFRQLWQRGEERLGELFVGGPASCRTVLCLYDGERLSGVDPRTGERRWSTGWPIPAGFNTVDEPPAPWPDGYLLVRTEESEWRWLLDARTGERLLALDRWLLEDGPGSPEPVLTRRDVDAGRTWIARLLPGGGEVRIFAIDSPQRTCTANAEFLVCTGRRPEAHVYRIG